MSLFSTLEYVGHNFLSQEENKITNIKSNLFTFISIHKDTKLYELINEKSLYLLKHAHNPVKWQSWNEETLKKAKKENKIIILSIGYSTCHWCHVMERESFQDKNVAEFMNKYFISIKVDREERPDIDNIYMDAIQKMGVQGGWPLNIFLLPNQKPFYGGTYFTKNNWLRILENIKNISDDNMKKIVESSDEFTIEIINCLLYTSPSPRD